MVTKYFISKVEQKDVGGSTLSARKIWWDEVVSRLNNEGRGKLLGSFKGDDKILTVYSSGHYLLSNFELSNKFSDDLIHIEKWHPERPVACVYWNAARELFFVKRFKVETLTKKYQFIGDNDELTVVSTHFKPKVNISFNKRLKETKDLKDKMVELNDIIEIKGEKAQGNQLTRLKVKNITLLDIVDGEDWPIETEQEAQVLEINEKKDENPLANNASYKKEGEKAIKTPKAQAVDTKSKIDPTIEKPIEVEWDIDDDQQDLDDNGQIKIF